MRSFHGVYMRGGTSKGIMFKREELPANREEWDDIFLQVMGNPDPKQIDGLGGTVSSNNKIVIVWNSDEPGVDVEYLVGQVIVGKNQVDYKSNCGNMTAAVGPFAVDEGMVQAVEPITTVRMLNRNTDKYINVTVPVENGASAQEGDCSIAGIDGTAAELKVNFLNPAGAKTGKLLPTGNAADVLEIPGHGQIEATILDVSNPLVMVRAKDVGLTGLELPEEVNGNQQASGLLEKVRGVAAQMLGFCATAEEAGEKSPAIPKIGFFTAPSTYIEIGGKTVAADEMDVCARVISVFKCHKAAPLTSANAIAVAMQVAGSVLQKEFGGMPAGRDAVRVGHPSGVMTLYPQIQQKDGRLEVPGVAVQRTARRIMDGTVYVRR